LTGICHGARIVVEGLQLPGIKEVAARAGVSPSTASRVFHGRGSVSEATRKRVLRAAEALGYEPNLAASMLRSQISTIVGVEVQDITNSFYASVATGVAGVVRAAGYVPMLSDSQEDPERQAENLRVMLRTRVAGLIVVSTLASVTLLQRFQQLAIPLVQLDRAVSGIDTDSVMIDNRMASRLAVEHLVKLGHERIATIAGPQTSMTRRERLLGFEAVMQELGLEPDPRYVKVSDFRRETGAALTRELLRVRPRPTAIFAHNNVLAESVLKVLQAERIRVPEEMAVIGFDDTSWATLVTPPLSVVDQPTARLGEIAAELLLDQICGAAASRELRHIQLEPRLLIRGSCGGSPSHQAR
jgi:DNA-binding LacI/PurR family transcriptional regulator